MITSRGTSLGVKLPCLGRIYTPTIDVCSAVSSVLSAFLDQRARLSPGARQVRRLNHIDNLAPVHKNRFGASIGGRTSRCVDRLIERRTVFTFACPIARAPRQPDGCALSHAFKLER